MGVRGYGSPCLVNIGDAIHVMVLIVIEFGGGDNIFGLSAPLLRQAKQGSTEQIMHQKRCSQCACGICAYRIVEDHDVFVGPLPSHLPKTLDCREDCEVGPAKEA